MAPKGSGRQCVTGEPMHSSIDIDRIMEAIESEDSIGFCIECGEETSGVEPDARKYLCEGCGANAVYGAEELLVMVQA